MTPDERKEFVRRLREKAKGRQTDAFIEFLAYDATFLAAQLEADREAIEGLHKTLADMITFLEILAPQIQDGHYNGHTDEIDQAINKIWDRIEVIEAALSKWSPDNG